VKIDSDEVLARHRLQVGRRHPFPRALDPQRRRPARDRVARRRARGPRLQKEDKDGRLILSKKPAQYERAWGTIEEIKEKDGIVKGPVIEVVKGG